MFLKEKKRILITIVGQGSISHIIRSGILEGMQQYCIPVIGILWDDQSLREELTAKGIENHVIPAFTLSSEYRHLRANIDVWYLSKVLQSPSTKIQRRYLAKQTPRKKNIKNCLRRNAFYLQHLLPGYTRKTLKKEQGAILKEPVYERYAEWLNHLQIDGLYTVTPFLLEVEILARICRKKHLPVVASIHSFDNITKRNWTGIFFDHYIVWNKYNKAELIRINPALKDKITIAGVPHFDFHFNPSFVMSKEDWLNKVGLPKNKKIILYGGGPVSLFPDEPQYLQHLKEALDKNEMIQDVLVLFRSHPLDKIERWIKKVEQSPAIFYDAAPNGTIKLDYINVTCKDIQMLIATLKYTDVHINLCSTMTVDGSVFKKPQIGPAYDEIKPRTQHLLKDMYLQEHYLPIIRSGNVHLAHSKQQLIKLVNQALESPESMTQHADECVHEIISFSDGKSAERVCKKLQEFFS